MEGGKSQEVQLTSWRPRRADSVSSSLKVSSLETEEELMFQLESKGRRRSMSQLNQPGGRSSLLLSERAALLVSSGLQLIGQGPPALEGHLLFLDFPGGSHGKASAYNVGDPGSIPGSGRSPGEGSDNPLQYSCLENPMDWGAWWATVHGVAKNRT